jgi:RNA recognition motif-containing protein
VDGGLGLKNVPDIVSQGMLVRLCESWGRVLWSTVMRRRNGRVNFAFVSYESGEEAKRAVSELDGLEWCGSRRWF